MREERVVLEDHVHVAPVRQHRRDVYALQENPPLAGRFEARDHPECRGLAAAARAEQREELALTDGQRDAVHRDIAPEALGHALERDAGAPLLLHGASLGRRWLGVPGQLAVYGKRSVLLGIELVEPSEAAGMERPAPWRWGPLRVVRANTPAGSVHRFAIGSEQCFADYPPRRAHAVAIRTRAPKVLLTRP